MCENSIGIIMNANLRNCTSLYRRFMFSVLHIIDKRIRLHWSLPQQRKTAIRVVHFCHDCSCLQYQLIIESTRISWTHNFTNWLQSAQRRRYPVLMNSTMRFIFVDLLTVANFFMKGLLIIGVRMSNHSTKNTSHFLRKLSYAIGEQQRRRSAWWAPLLFTAEIV